jgi:outer membrane receptor protein involved in Fe transport
MRKSFWFVSAGMMALAQPAWAQEMQSERANNETGATQEEGAIDATQQAGAVQDADDNGGGQGEIIVTATRRNEALSDVPLAVSAVTAETLENTGATDIRQLNQVSPSLLVTSTSSEAGAGTARIRGIGTVGDNPGLESSVATFIDGVYRSRAGVALTELGSIDRIEVLRGPQGTLFGRNASAGLIHVITARPRFEQQGTAELTYGNYDFMRAEGSLTGPIAGGVAYRLDGVYVKRDGFLRDVISGRDINNRDRYLVRGQLLFEPNDALSVRLIGDYAKRDEECCGASFLPARNVTRGADGNLIFSPSNVIAFERALGAVINDDTFDRETSITPGRSYRSDVEDFGFSGEVNYDFGGVTATSITAYRENEFIRGQDADFNNLDIFYRDDDGSGFTRFKTFTQELRLQGELFDGKLDWLIGGYYADEKLTLADNISFGADADRFATSTIRAANPAFAAFPGFNLLNPFAGGFLAGQLATNPAFAGVPVAARPLVINAIQSQVQNTPLAGVITRDRFQQDSRNYALFTHNIFNITDQLSVTLGLRYTNERKTLSADLNSTSNCGTFLANIGRLRALATSAGANPGGNGGLNPAIAGLAGALANQVLTPIAGLPCAINSVNGDFDGGRKSEDEFTGTAVVSFKPTDRVLTYASYSRGYKAGGFNLDRAGLTFGAENLNSLQFEPEIVDAYELGTKYNGRDIDVNVAVFRQDFNDFQLNTFNGVNFVVENVSSCSEDLNGADTDLSGALVPCTGKRKAGVRSQGVEVEAFLRPSRDFSTNIGFTYADTKYRRNLVGAAGNALIAALFQLPGQRLSNSGEFVVTGSAGWTPDIGDSGLTGLVYADFRYQSELNTGSDLDEEKLQDGVMVVNARVGLRGPDKRWGIELFAQNLFDVDYKQIGFDAPLQGSGTIGATRAFGTPSNGLFAAFLAEPRTYGITVRTKF